MATGRPAAPKTTVKTAAVSGIACPVVTRISSHMKRLSIKARQKPAAVPVAAALRQFITVLAACPSPARDVFRLRNYTGLQPYPFALKVMTTSVPSGGRMSLLPIREVSFLDSMAP